MAVPRPLDGDDREDAATHAGISVASIYLMVELELVAAITDSVKASLRTGAVTVRVLSQLRRRIAAVLATAERQARNVVEAAGVPWDYQPVIPAGMPAQLVIPAPAASASAQVTGSPATLGAPTSPGTPATGLPPAPDLAAAMESRTEQPVKDLIEGVSGRVYREIPDIYQQAVEQAVAATRGGMPATSLSLSRIQAAQKALDYLAEHGITGFTDRAGRQWDLLAYIEMATRTAVSNAYDNLQNTALIRSGHDLVLVYTLSAEGSCPHCLPWIGKILSLTGATTGPVSITDSAGHPFHGTVHATLAEARAAGFRHPNCRCSMLPLVNGADLFVTTQFAEPSDRAAATYAASQEQRAYERRIRRMARETRTGLTPQARTRARANLIAAQRAAAAHRARTGLRMTRVGVARRHHPYNAH